MIDIKTHSKLREQYNPDNSSLRQYQMHLVDVLKDFDKACKEIGVEYWLSQGTVLGAVRHGGFIPWDDDVDVEMTYDNYKKFCKSFIETEKYALQTIHTDKHYTLPFAKFREKGTTINDSNSIISSYYKYRGPFIDIFYSEYSIKSISKIINKFFVGAAFLKIRFGVNIITNILSSTLKNCGELLANLARYTFKSLPSKKFGLGYGSHFYEIESNYSDIYPLSTIEFESESFPAPNNCDGYLKKIYGDYMSLPKEVERKTHLNTNS